MGNASDGYQGDEVIEMRNSEESCSGGKERNEEDEMLNSLRCGSSLSQIEEKAENFARENTPPLENGTEECDP